jgi:hypothetical protein
MFALIHLSQSLLFCICLNTATLIMIASPVMFASALVPVMDFLLLDRVESVAVILPAFLFHALIETPPTLLLSLPSFLVTRLVTV